MYELLYIIPSPFSEKDLPEISKKVEKIITDLKGKIVEQKELGNKKLAYNIKQIYKGFYFLINFEIDTDNLPKLNKRLRLTPEILRHMIVKAIIPKPKRERKKNKEVPKIESFEDIKNVKI